jgi:hypothetical protein
MSKTIIYAGYSRLGGKLKFRTAATEGRVDQLARTDDDLHMIEIEPCSTKGAAAKQLLALDHAKGDVEIEKLYSWKALDDNPFKKTSVVVRVPTMAMTRLTGAQVETSEKMTAKEAAQVRAAWNRAHADLSYDGE